MNKTMQGLSIAAAIVSLILWNVGPAPAALAFGICGIVANFTSWIVRCSP